MTHAEVFALMEITREQRQATTDLAVLNWPSQDKHCFYIVRGRAGVTQIPIEGKYVRMLRTSGLLVIDMEESKSS